MPYPLRVSKLLSRVEKVTAVLAALFVNSVVLGWWKTHLGTPLMIGLEYAVPALFAIWYTWLEGIWWRSRRKDDREGMDADWYLALALTANAVLLLGVLLVKGVNTSTHEGVYPLMIYLMFVPGFVRDIGTSIMAKFGLGHLKP